MRVCFVPTCVGVCRGLEGLYARVSMFLLCMCQQARRYSIKPQRPINAAVCLTRVEEEEAERGRGGSNSNGGDSDKYVVSDPLIRHQGVCAAIRFKWGVALPCWETEAWQSAGEDVCECKNITSI